VSIATDGRVLEWNLKKGLIVSSLMQLKKSGTVSYNSNSVLLSCRVFVDVDWGSFFLIIALFCIVLYCICCLLCREKGGLVTRQRASP
jgi:hypothetical protein